MRCASEIIKSEFGTITAYDGDRVMGIAARTAMKINYAVEKIIRPEFEAFYKNSSFLVKHVIGIDRTILHAARIGVHGDNDIVWVGRAANYAAKLCTLSEKPIWITKAIYDNLRDELKYTNQVHMWERRLWSPMNNMEIYSSQWWWPVP